MSRGCPAAAAAILLSLARTASKAAPVGLKVPTPWLQRCATGCPKIQKQTIAFKGPVGEGGLIVLGAFSLYVGGGGLIVLGSS